MKSCLEVGLGIPLIRDTFHFQPSLDSDLLIDFINDFFDSINDPPPSIIKLHRSCTHCLCLSCRQWRRACLAEGRRQRAAGEGEGGGGGKSRRGWKEGGWDVDVQTGSTVRDGAGR